MPSNREKRNAQQRARRARAQSGKSSSHLPNGLTWQPSLAEGKPVQEGEPVVVGHAIAEEPEVIDLPEEMEKLKLNTALPAADLSPTRCCTFSLDANASPSNVMRSIWSAP